jgi:hypothetical protein
MTVYRSTPTLAHVSLDGSNSSDPDGDALAFTWLEGGTQIATGSNPAVDFALGTHNIELGVSDGRGGESHDFVVVDVVNRPPVVSTGGPYTGFEGSNVAFAATASDADQDELSYGWSLGEGAAAAGPAFPTSHTYSDNGNYSASFSASDRFGGNDSKSTTVSIANVAPEARITGRSASPLSGSLFTLSGAFSDPGANDAPWNWRINWGDGTSATGVASSQADAITAQHRYVRADRYTVELAVTDKDGGVGTTNAIITVIAAEENVAPVVRRITLPASPIPVGAAASVRADFSDGNAGDTHTATIDWEGTTTAGVVTEAGGSGTVTGSNTYPAPGVYTVNVFVNDGDLSGTRSSAGDTPAYIVVYDPSAGFVTGGGWINSPAAACQLTSVCGGATGKATFGFVARYKKGATTPSGDTEFQFSAGGLRFVSSNYDWLTVAGSRAKYKGSGQINGAGNYGFLITAIDGDLNGGGPDQFRIKITDPATGTVVYDNKRGEPEDSDAATPIGGGSIVIHK